MTRLLLLAITLIVTALVVVSPPQAADASQVVLAQSSFDADLDGWTSNQDTKWKSRGGRPGGYIRFEDATGSFSFIFAPAKFFSAIEQAGRSGQIIFFHRIIGETNIKSVNPYTVELSGPHGAATWTGDMPTGTTPWVKVKVPLKQRKWTVTSGTWRGLMRKITSFSIQIELVTNNQIPGDTDIEGVDEVKVVTSAQ
jgi:hypothetical protein